MFGTVIRRQITIENNATSLHTFILRMLVPAQRVSTGRRVTTASAANLLQLAPTRITSENHTRGSHRTQSYGNATGAFWKCLGDENVKNLVDASSTGRSVPMRVEPVGS